MDLTVVRSDYRKGALERSDLLENPIAQLQNWLEAAIDAKVPEPYAMCVSTVAPSDRPSSRFVLLRGLDPRGLTFYTNYESRKGHELSENPFACVAFWWAALERQVRVEGRVEKVSAEESDAYFKSRPHESQVASAASPQSTVVTDREELETKVRELATTYPNEVPRPDRWGGYRLIPDCFEFWQGRSARLHDRFRYQKEGQIWRIDRLAP